MPLNLTDRQKHLLEIGALVGGGVLLWWLLSGDGEPGIATTLPPNLGIGGATPNPQLTLNYPGSGPIDFPGVGPVDIQLGSSPFNVDLGDFDIPPLTFPGFLGDSNNISLGDNCGCCTSPPPSGNAFATPEQAMAIIARVNPYSHQVGDLPGHAAQTQGGFIIPDGALIYNPGQEVPVESIAGIPGASWSPPGNFAAAAGYG